MHLYPKDSLQFKRTLIAKVKELPNIWPKRGIWHRDWKKVKDEMNAAYTLGLLRASWLSLRAAYYRKIFRRTIERNFEAPEWPLFHDMSFLYPSIKEKIQNKLGGISPPLFKLKLEKDKAPKTQCPCCIYSFIENNNTTLDSNTCAAEKIQIPETENNLAVKEKHDFQTINISNIPENMTQASEVLINLQQTENCIQSPSLDESFCFIPQNELPPQAIPHHQDSYYGQEILPTKNSTQHSTSGIIERLSSPPSNSVTENTESSIVTPNILAKSPSDHNVGEVIDLIDDDDEIMCESSANIIPAQVSLPNSSSVTITNCQTAFNLGTFQAVSLQEVENGVQIVPVPINENESNTVPQELLQYLLQLNTSTTPVTPESVVALKKNLIENTTTPAIEQAKPPETNQQTTNTSVRSENPQSLFTAANAWSKSVDEWYMERKNLIEAIKANPNSYRAPRCQAAWVKISKAVNNVAIYNLKSRWRKIKSRYVKELMAERFGNKKSRWEHFDQMEFYRPYMENELKEIQKTRDRIEDVVQKKAEETSKNHNAPIPDSQTSSGLGNFNATTGQTASAKSIVQETEKPITTSTLKQHVVLDPSSLPILQNRPIKITAIQSIPSLDLTNDDDIDETLANNCIPPAKKLRPSAELQVDASCELSQGPIISSVQTGFAIDITEQQNKTATNSAMPVTVYPPLDLTLDEDENKDNDDTHRTSESNSCSENMKPASKYQEAFLNTFANVEKVYQKFDVNSAKSKESNNNGVVEAGSDDNVICLDDNNSNDSYEEVIVYI